MALSHVELYEALKPTLGETAAEMIAEVVSRNPATRADLERLEAATRANLESLAVRLEAKIDSKVDTSQKEMMRWMLTFFIPVWAGTWGMVLAVLLKG